VALAALGAYVGVWAYFATESWYRSFPGAGLHWLPVLGPYNEHLSKDVGALYLALMVLSLSAARLPSNTPLVQATGLTWFTFSVPHLAYHLQHLDMYGRRDQVLNVVSLGLFVVAAAALLLPGPGSRVEGAESRPPSSAHRGDVGGSPDRPKRRRQGRK
jgi:hypothetical protein